MGALKRFFCTTDLELDLDEEFVLVCEVEPGYKRLGYRIKAWLHL